MQRILLAATGASGSIYAERLAQVLLSKCERLYLVFSETAEKVVRHELRSTPDRFCLVDAIEQRLAEHDRQKVRIFRNDDLFAPISSGSAAPDAMVIVPCSMGSLARIANGVSSNLLERAADVVLKQKRPLVIVPRETPLNRIHLRNMLTLSEMGTEIVPAMPAFYHKPKSIDDLVDFIIGRILECLGISHELYPVWNSRMV